MRVRFGYRYGPRNRELGAETLAPLVTRGAELLVRGRLHIADIFVFFTKFDVSTPKQWSRRLHECG